MKIQPVLTGVTPQLLAPGKGYTLTLHGKGLTQQMALDFGPGIAILAGSLSAGAGPRGDDGKRHGPGGG